jgi:hypothetical protein
MRRFVALAVVLVLMVALAAPAAHAHGGAAASVALGLASFAAFTTFLGILAPRPVYAGYPYVYGAYPAPVVYRPAYPRVVYTQPAQVVYTQPAPAYSQPAPAYTQPAPVYTQPAPAYTRPAPVRQPAPSSNVVHHPNGRYELRGDGIQTAYQWVWIPNPPADPPPTTASR